MRAALSVVFRESEGKIFQDKMQTVCKLLNVNAILYFKFKLQLKCRNNKNYSSIFVYSMNVGPCHHGMARPQVADGGTTSNMEGSCE